MTAADHLEVPRQHGLFNHHGINLGDGTVAHYLEGKAIIRSSLEEFSNGTKITIVQHQNTLSPEVTLKRAMSRLGESQYSLLFNNCEHFANWCKTGKNKSEQIDNAIITAQLGSQKIYELLPKELFIGLDFEDLQNMIDKQKIDQFKQEITKLESMNFKLNESLDKLINKIKDLKSREKKIFRSLNLKKELDSDKLNSLDIMKQKIENLFKI